MAIFPYYDVADQYWNYTENQVKWLAAIQYLMIALNLGTLTWLIINAVTILIKQRKYNVLPLVNFYCLTAMLVVFRTV